MTNTTKDLPDLIEIARATGLREAMHGIDALTARALLKKFVAALSKAAPAEGMDLIELMRQCGGRGTKRSDADGERLIVSGSDLKRFLNACAPTPPLVGVEAMRRAVACLKILNERPRPMCRDCADSRVEGICDNGGLNCDMGQLIEEAEAALASHTAPAETAVAMYPRAARLLADPQELEAFVIAAEKNADNWLRLNREFTDYREAHPAPAGEKL